MDLNKNISRREFLKISGMLAGAMILPRAKAIATSLTQEWPVGAHLGRVCVGELRSFIDLKSEPNMNAPNTTRVWRDDVLRLSRK